MKRGYHVYVSVLFAVLSGFFTGCHTDPYPIVELEGIATFDGKPLQNVNLIFRPQDNSGKTSTAFVAEGGKFIAAYSADRRGVKAGELDVHVGTVDQPGYEANEAGKKAVEQYGYQTPPLVISISKQDKNYQLDFKPRQ